MSTNGHKIGAAETISKQCMVVGNRCLGLRRAPPIAVFTTGQRAMCISVGSELRSRSAKPLLSVRISVQFDSVARVPQVYDICVCLSANLEIALVFGGVVLSVKAGYKRVCFGNIVGISYFAKFWLIASFAIKVQISLSVFHNYLSKMFNMVLFPLMLQSSKSNTTENSIISRKNSN